MFLPAYLLALFLICCPATHSSTIAEQATGGFRISYTGNMGVLIQTTKTAVWIDGLHEYYGPGYLHPPDSILDKAFTKTGDFNRLQWLLFTHYHRDHFSAPLTNRFLQISAQHKAAGAPQVLDSLSSSQVIDAWDRNETIIYDSAAALQIQAFNIPHTWPQRHAKVQNIAYRLELEGTSILHIGDAGTDIGTFEKLGITKTAIVIVPSWFLLSKDGKDIIEKYDPVKVIVTHIAPGERFKGKYSIKNAEIILFDTIGDLTGI